MSAQLAKVLQELNRQADIPLFQTSTGTMLEPSNLYKAFRSFLEDAGLRRIQFHDLRHTFATQHISNNQSLAYIRDQLGHFSIKVTQSHRRSVRTSGPGYNKKAADMLDDGSKWIPETMMSELSMRKDGAPGGI
jgi:integrase